MPTHIKLYGDKSDRFEQIKAKLAEDLGYEPSNPEVVGLLMARQPQIQPELVLTDADENWERNDPIRDW